MEGRIDMLSYRMGAASAGGSSGRLQPATKSTLGGVIIGDGLDVDSTGLLSVVCATDEEVAEMISEVFGTLATT